MLNNLNFVSREMAKKMLNSGYVVFVECGGFLLPWFRGDGGLKYAERKIKKTFRSEYHSIITYQVYDSDFLRYNLTH